MGKCRAAFLPSDYKQKSQAQAALGHQTSRTGRYTAAGSLHETCALDTLSSSSTTLTLSNREISEMRLGNGSVFMIFIKTEKQSGVCSTERGGMRDVTAVTGVREGYGGQENSSLLSGADKVVCSSLELAHTCLHRHCPSPNTQSVCTTALVLSNDGTSERRSSFSGLDPLGRFC